MAETLTIKCDRCGSRIGKASRTRIRWSVEPARREPVDLCPDCALVVLVVIGKAAPEPEPAAVVVKTTRRRSATR
jgi:hypothetical protein